MRFLLQIVIAFAALIFFTDGFNVRNARAQNNQRPYGAVPDFSNLIRVYGKRSMAAPEVDAEGFEGLSGPYYIF
uniref:Uncharacterized protein n=1 Tax=Panagrellus redivivus TaxID=6233 RepID=A0A7E4W647_PANRE